MRTFIYFLALVNGSENMALAQESKELQNPENTNMNKDSDLTSGTKKILRKVGRKARDESCHWTEDNAKCISEKAEHASLNKADNEDTKKRKMQKASKEYLDKINKIESE